MDNWQEIDDHKTREMLEEIFENIHDDDLMERYFLALEKKHRKPEGTISDFIFHHEYSIDEIMIKLKIDTVTYL